MVPTNIRTAWQKIDGDKHSCLVLNVGDKRKVVLYDWHQDEGERLQVVGRHPIDPEEDRPQELSLRSVETGPKDVGDTSVVRRAETWSRWS